MLYRVIRAEMSILWEVTVSAIDRKIVQMNMFLILIAYLGQAL